VNPNACASSEEAPDRGAPAAELARMEFDTWQEGLL